MVASSKYITGLMNSKLVVARMACLRIVMHKWQFTAGGFFRVRHENQARGAHLDDLNHEYGRRDVALQGGKLHPSLTRRPTIWSVPTVGRTAGGFRWDVIRLLCVLLRNYFVQTARKFVQKLDEVSLVLSCCSL